MSPPRLAACVKWVDLRPEIDPLSGAVTTDERRYGFSSADQAALEVALRLAESCDGEVTLICAGPATAEPALRELAATGARHVVRVDLGVVTGGEVASAHVGSSIGAALSASGPGAVVVCGDHSVDRGSGSVPGYLAHALGSAGAFGLVDVTTAWTGSGSLAAVRRLDGGRRERLRLAAPAVLSVEGSVARLRRAPLHEVIAARSMAVETFVALSARLDASSQTMAAVGDPEPWRPRPRRSAAPSGDRALDRIVALTGALVERTPPRRIELPAGEAADAILDQLRTWGYIE